MNRQQHIAYRYPCFLAEETANTRYGVSYPKLRAKVMLTFNVGEE